MNRKRQHGALAKAIGTVVSLAMILGSAGIVWAWNQHPHRSDKRLVWVSKVVRQINALVPTPEGQNAQHADRQVAVFRRVGKSSASTNRHAKDLKIDTNAAAKDIFLRTNAERRKHGVPPLKWDEHLAEVARWRATDMVTRHYLSHYDPVDGHLLVHDRVHASALGENACRIPLTIPDSLGKRSVSGWMHSPHHRENMLSPVFDKIGVGVACNKEHYCYAVQVFAR